MENREELLARLHKEAKFRKISPFEVCRDLTATKRKYTITGTTRKEIDDQYDEILKKLKMEFGEYMVEETHEKIDLRKDDKGNVLEGIKYVEFTCFIPLKNDEKKQTR